MTISIGDFAEQILAQDELKSTEAPQPPSIQPDPSVYSPDVTQQAPDISNVEVPNDFVNSICEGKTPVIPEDTVKEVAPTSQPISEVAELKSLVQEVKELLIDFKQTLVEMNSVGMFGAGSSTSCPPKKKKEKDPLEKLLKQIRSKRASS